MLAFLISWYSFSELDFSIRGATTTVNKPTENGINFGLRYAHN